MNERRPPNAENARAGRAALLSAEQLAGGGRGTADPPPRRHDLPRLLAAALEPEQAAVVGELLGAQTLIPIHYGGYPVDPWYHPTDDPIDRFDAAAGESSYDTRILRPGESFEPLAAPVDS